jgi:hypothetical protein
MSTLKATLPAQDYHVQVTDTDSYSGHDMATCPDSAPDGQCCGWDSPIFGHCNYFPYTSCEGVPCTPGTTECDKTLGAAFVRDKEGEPCGVDNSGLRWMTQDQPALDDTFACIAEVGVLGDNVEKVMEAMMEAVSDDLNAAGACNDGFIRDDAILVVTFITDEEDMIDAYNLESPGDPPDWKQALVDAKGGNTDAIVILGLTNDNGLPNRLCDLDPGKASPRLIEFVELFGWHGVWGSVCEPDYNPFFQSAVDVIHQTCLEFDPEG